MPRRRLPLIRCAQPSSSDDEAWLDQALSDGSTLAVPWLTVERALAGSRRTAIEAAIADGRLRWHALPMALQVELLDAALVAHALDGARRLDQRFGVRTTVAVCAGGGPTRGVVPVLAAAGVRVLVVELDAVERAPQLPAAFRWQAGTQSIVVALARRRIATGVAALLAGPGEELPRAPADADLVAVALAAFADELAEAELPTISAELGDTWIAATGGDPYATARLRALLRLRRQWVEQGLVHDAVDAVARFSDGLVRVAARAHLAASVADLAAREGYDTAAVAELRRDAATRAAEAMWAEPRAAIDEAVAALPTELRREARAVARDVLPDPFDTRGFRQIEPREELRLTRFILRLDPATGAIATLRRLADRRDWATPASPLALVRYQTFDADDYERFRRAHLTGEPERGSALSLLAMPGLARTRPVSSLWLARLERATWRIDDDADRLLLSLSLPDEARKRYGAPRRLELLVTLPRDDDRIDLDLRWFGKPRSRLPEATWLTVAPAGTDDAWTLDKLGHDVAPDAVVAGAGRRLHGVGVGARWRGDGSFALETLDAHLIAPGSPGLLDPRDGQVHARTGMHVCLHTNALGGPAWYDEDARFRFTCRFG